MDPISFQTIPNHPSMPIVAYSVYLAVEEMTAVKAEWEMTATQPINPSADQALEVISDTIQKIETLLRLQLAKKLSFESTLRVIASLKESKVDYMLLLYLQLPDSIRKKSELISSLESLCNQLQADFMARHFYNCIWSIFESEGVSPVTPDKFVTANRKEDVLNHYAKVEKPWGRHRPLFLQMYDTKDGAFTNHVYFIFRTAQDGIMRLLDSLKSEEVVSNTRVVTTCGAFEHVIGPSTLTCQLYDCEIMSSAFKESTDEVKAMVRGFPSFLSSVMIDKNIINMEDFLTFSVKDRTRQISGGRVKISFHFTPFICATKAMHSKAVKICLEEYKADIDQAAACIKSTGLMPGGLQPKPFRTLDYKAINNGITTAFSRKTRDDTFPRHVYTEELCGGCVVDREGCTTDPQDLHGPNLSDKERLMLIYVQLYTTPKKEMICYNEAAFEAEVFFFFFFYFLLSLGFEPIHPMGKH
jgi:hypothetical protein